MSCVFDVAEDHMDEVREVCEAEDWIEVCTELPPLKVGHVGFGERAVCLEECAPVPSAGMRLNV